MLENKTSFQKLQTEFRLAYLERWSREAAQQRSPEAWASINERLRALGGTDDEQLFFAIHVKEKGNHELAKHILQSLTESNEPHIGALYESGVLWITVSYKIGCDYLLAAVERQNTLDRAIRLLTFAAVMRGDVSLLERVRATADPEILRRTEWDNSTFVKYLDTVGSTLPWRKGEDAGLFDLDGISIKYQADVAARLSDGKSNMLRIGDGEGALFVFDLVEELEFASLYSPARSHLTRRFVGCDYDTIARPMFSWRQTISETLPQIDILGCPDGQWMLAALVEADVRCFVSLLNGWRRIAAVKPHMRRYAVFTTTSVVYDLLHHDSLAQALRGTEGMALVSWHDLHRADILGHPQALRFILIPPSTHDVQALGLTVDAMSVADAIALPDRIFQETAEVETVALCGGYVAKTSAKRLISGGRRVLDLGSAPDMTVGRPIR
jgi:hypothetical protein